VLISAQRHVAYCELLNGPENGLGQNAYYSHVTNLLLCCSPPAAAQTDPNGLSPRQIKSDSDDDDLPNVTLDSVNETGSTALSIARAVQEWVSSKYTLSQTHQPALEIKLQHMQTGNLQLENGIDILLTVCF